MTLAEEKEMGTSTSPSVRDSIKKKAAADNDDASTKHESECGSERETPAATEMAGEGEYPDATRMAFIVIALLLSIFLVSVHVDKTWGAVLTIAGGSGYDYCGHSHPQNNR